MSMETRPETGSALRLQGRAAGMITLAAMLVVTGVVTAAAAAPDRDDEAVWAAGAAANTEVPHPDASAGRAPCDLSLQVGWLVRAGDADVREDKASFLVVGDIFALWGPRPGDAPAGEPGAGTGAGPRGLTRRGLVIHLSGDDDGSRHGLGYVHRRYLRADRHAYVQFAPALILAASDHYRTVRLPSAYLSVQAGNDRTLAFCLAVEIVRYREALLKYAPAPDDPPGWNSLPVVDPEGTQVAWHVGGVLHGWPGVVGLVALCVGAGLAMSSSGL